MAKKRENKDDTTLNGHEAIGKLTPTQRKMFAVLADRRPHTADELGTCLWDEQAQVFSTVAFHISIFRKVLRPWSLGIYCESIQGTRYYSLVDVIYPTVPTVTS